MIGVLGPGVNGMNNKIGIYVRESRDENGENYETIETQRDLLIKYIKDNKLGSIKRIYIDDNVSGTGFERDGIKALKRSISDNEINLIVIKDLSRLGRNNAKTLLFLDFLEEKGVRVITYDGRYDSKKDNDMVGIETWFNERYCRDISKKIRANLRFKIEKGEYIGNAPFGYEKSQHKKNKLVVNREQAENVKKIYNLYKQGYGYRYIAQVLNKDGVRSPTMGDWNAVGVMRILGNRVYAGDTVQGVSEKISFKSKKTRRLPQSDWVITPNTHEPIISKEEFWEIQKTRNQRRKRFGAHKGTIHVFRGLIYCGGCKSIMFARKRQERPMGYICSNYSKLGTGACTSHHVRERELCDIISRDLMKLFDDTEMVNAVSEKLLHDRQIESKESIHKRLKKQVEIKKRQQEKLYLDRLEEKISESLFIRINTQFEELLLSFKKEIAKLEDGNDQSCDKQIMVHKFREYIKKNGIDNEIARITIDRVIVFEKDDPYNESVWKLDLDNDERQCLKQNGAVFIEYKF